MRSPSASPLWITILLSATLSCANPERQNPFDSVNATTIEIQTVTEDNGSVLIRWRYFDGAGVLSTLVVRKVTSLSGTVFPAEGDLVPILNSVGAVVSVDVVQGTGATTVGLLPAATRTTDWIEASLRDPEIVRGVRYLYQVVGLDASGKKISSSTIPFEAQ